MGSVTEGRLSFSFSDESIVAKYDEWSFYRNQFSNAFGGSKAVDLIYIDPESTWLIEVKDYRAHKRTKSIDIGDEIALKVRDTLAGLAAAKCNASDPEERRLAALALRRNKLKVVLHIEQPQKDSKLFSRIVDPSNLKLKLKQKVRAVDAHPAVVDMRSLNTQMPWKVTG